MRLATDGILRDTMMLENQIPIVVLKNILFIECSEPNSSHVASKKKKKSPIIEKYLPQMLWGYCKALSPFNLLENYPASIALKHAHLLDLLYNLIMLKEPPEEMAAEEEEDEDEEEERKPVGKNFLNTKFVKEAAGILLSLDIPKDIKKPIELVKGLLELPSPKLDPNSIKNVVHVEKEILIPTASSLCDVGVKFITDHITAIEFERDKTSFKLPLLMLDVNSEVVIRNLVAYEAMSKSESESLILAVF